MVDFPKAWKTMWNEWDIRVFVLTSLMLQIVLVIFAPWRRRKASKTLSLFIWSNYLLADWVAAFTLGLLCTSRGPSDSSGNNGNVAGGSKMVTTWVSAFGGSKQNNIGLEYDVKLLAFWAPFLLLHLGGPDAITAFAMEDNELWPRHLLGLLFEVGAAFYVFLLSIPKNKLMVPTILMFVTGIIKYGERTYALYLGSSDGFRNSVADEPDPGPDYTKLMYEENYMVDCGVPATIKRVNFEEREKGFSSHGEDQKELNADSEVKIEADSEVNKLRTAHNLFNKFKGIMVELIFSTRDGEDCRKTFGKKSGKDAFRLVEFELSFVYGVLFTKAAVTHQRLGYILRAVCSCSIMVAFFCFFSLSQRQDFSDLDTYVTYTLLVGAILLDSFAFLRLLLSDLTVVKIKSFPEIVSNLIIKLRPHHRWTVSVAQHSLINYCIPTWSSWRRRIMDRPTLLGKMDEMLCVQKMFRLTKIGAQLMDEMQYTWIDDVTDELKEYIYWQLGKKATGEVWRMWSYRGDFALEERGYFNTLGDSVEVEFDESLLLWHIATDLCYYTADAEDSASIPIAASTHRKFCKLLSDYMMYLLVMRPSMMSSSAVIGKIRYQDTCAETKRFFVTVGLLEIFGDLEKTNFWGPNMEGLQKVACELLLGVPTTKGPDIMKGDRSKSVLFDACILAKKLKKLGEAKRWEIMCEVWIEMLAYAASHCPCIAHAQMLSKGGRLAVIDLGDGVSRSEILGVAGEVVDLCWNYRR